MSSSLGVLTGTLGFRVVGPVAIDVFGAGLDSYLEGESIGQIMLSSGLAMVFSGLTMGIAGKVNDISLVKNMKSGLVDKLNYINLNERLSKETMVQKTTKTTENIFHDIFSLDKEKFTALKDNAINEVKLYKNKDLLKELAINEVKEFTIDSTDSAISYSIASALNIPKKYLEDFIEIQKKQVLVN